MLESMLAALRKYHNLLRQNRSKSPLQDGRHDYLRLRVRLGHIEFSDYVFDWAPDDCQYRAPFPAADELTADTFAPLAKALAAHVQSRFHDPGNPDDFAHALHLVLELCGQDGAPGNIIARHEWHFADAARKAALQKRIQRYLGHILRAQRPIKNDEDAILLARHLCNFPLMGYGETGLLALDDDLLHLHTRRKNSDGNLTHWMILELQNWRKAFLARYGTLRQEYFSEDYTPHPELDPASIDATALALFVRIAYWRIAYGDDHGNGKADLQLAAKTFACATAAQYLQHGSGLLPQNLSRYRDDALDCHANDVLATATIRILEENASAYQHALHWLIRLLDHGFPRHYAITLHSKAKKTFLPLKGLAKSATHRFFAQAAQYPQTHEALAAYARAAIHEHAWYQDISPGEKSLMPGSYAVFALALADPRHFPLLDHYLNTIDREHQRAHRDFVRAFIDQYGVNASTLPLILKAIRSAPWDKPFKNLAKALQHPDTETLLTQALAPLDACDREETARLIWGSKAEKMLANLNPKE